MHGIAYLLICFSQWLAISAFEMNEPSGMVIKPNFVFILTDDLGNGEVGCFRQKLIKTSNIDGLDD